MSAQGWNQWRSEALLATAPAWIHPKTESMEPEGNETRQHHTLSEAIDDATRMLEPVIWRHNDSQIRLHLHTAIECCKLIWNAPDTTDELVAIYALHVVAIPELESEAIMPQIHIHLRDIVVMCCCRECKGAVTKEEYEIQVARAYGRTGIQPDWPKLGLAWWKIYGPRPGRQATAPKNNHRHRDRKRDHRESPA